MKRVDGELNRYLYGRAGRERQQRGRREDADLKIGHHIETTILLADDDGGAGADFLETAGVPEDAVNEGLARGVVRSEENLDAIAGPFRFAWQEIGNAHWNPPLGVHFVEKKVGS